MTKTLISGGCVLTLGAKTPNFTTADVLIEDGTVAEVGPGLRARDAEVVDAADTIVMPGFVDTHRHVWKSLFRNAGQDLAPLAEHYEPDDVYAATLVGLLGAIEAGITTVVDWSDTQGDDDSVAASLQAHVDAGLRTVLVLPHSSGHDDTDAATTTIAYGAAEPVPGDLDRTGADWGQAREKGLRIHTHAGMVPSSRGAVSDLAKRGLLGEDVTLVHGTNFDGADFDALASSGAALSLTPASEMAGGLGAPPIQALIDRGVRPGLGVDSERVAPGDLFAQMRATISLQHATLFDLKLAGKAGVPKLLTTRDVIRYATSDGAVVAGVGGVTGSIEPGKQADLIVLRADRPNIAPVNDPIGAVVWGMDTSNVDWVFAGGRALMRNGALEADVAHARDLATQAQDRVIAAAGQVAGAAAGGER